MTTPLSLRAINNKPQSADDATWAHMPHNHEAEQALLGLLLSNNAHLDKITDLLKEDHFFFPVHQRIFHAVVDLAERGLNATPITIKGFFENDADLQALGGQNYLADLVANHALVTNIRAYAETIYDHFLRRQLINIGQEIVDEAHTHSLDNPTNIQVGQAEQKIYQLAQHGEVKGGFIKFLEPLQLAIETAKKAFSTTGHITGVTTGLTDINKKMGGLQPSDLIILAGRPSMGKTSLATNMAYNAAKAHLQSGGREGAPVGFFSLEMSSEQLANRILSEVVEISSEKIRRGDLRDEDFIKFSAACGELAELPLFIDDTPGLTVPAIRARARRLQRQHGLGLIVIDYLQLLSGSGKRGGVENRVQEISEISRGLKSLAKELHVPVLALSQLSRQVEQRDDKRPQLSDLRESGSIEQDADVVMFVYRDEYYLSRKKPDPSDKEYPEWEQKMANAANKAECIIGKQRHGPIGTVELAFRGEFTKFSDLPNRPGDDRF